MDNYLPEPDENPLTDRIWELNTQQMKLIVKADPLGNGFRGATTTLYIL